MTGARRILSWLILGLTVMAGMSAATARPVLMLDSGGHMASIRKILFTADGKELISAGEDKMIRVWDFATGRTKRTLRGEIGPGSEGRITALALSPDGKWLAAGGMLESPGTAGYAIRLYDFESGALIGLLNGHRKLVSALEFSPDGRLLVSASYDHSAIIWDLAKRRRLYRLEGHTDRVKVAGFTPDGARVVTGANDHDLRLWRARDGALEARMAGHDDFIASLAISPVDGTIASGSRNGEIRLWDGKTGTAIRVLATGRAHVPALSFSPDGRHLLSGVARDNRCLVREVETGRVVASYDGHDDIVLATAVSPDGRWAVTGGGANHEIHVWGLTTGAPKTPGGADGEPLKFAGAGYPVVAVGLAADGRHIAWGNSWNFADENGRPRLERMLRLPTEVVALGQPAPLDRGQTAFLRARPVHGNWSLEARERDRLNGRRILEIRRGDHVVASIERTYETGYVHTAFGFGPGGRMIVSGGADGVLEAYTREGRSIGRYDGHTDEVVDLSVGADGRFLVSGSADQTLKLWNLATRELVVTLFQTNGGDWVMWTPQGYYTSSPDGDRFVGWHINQGADKPARYVTAAQLKKHLYSPEIVTEAIRLGSANKAVRRLRGSDPTLKQLLAKRPPDFAIVRPESGTRVATHAATVGVRIDRNADDVACCRVFVNQRQVSPRTLRGGVHLRPDAEAIELNVPLAKGLNRIRIVASNWVGETAREVVVENTAEGVLDERGTLYVVAIGVDKYPQLPGRDLSFAGADARAFVDAVMRRMGPMHKDVKTLLLVNDARGGVSGEGLPTKSNIENALAFFEDAEEQDTVLLFLGGHGENLRNKKRSYVFLPTGARIKHGRFEAASILKWSLISQAIGDAGGRRMVFVDTCHAAGAVNNRLIYDAAKEDIIAFSATDTETSAIERPDIGHGIFTKALLTGLNGKADYDADGRIHVLEFAKHVTVEVKNLSNQEQVPKIYSREYADFVLATLR